MKTLKTQVERYIKLRRQLGYKLKTSEKILIKFASFSEEHGVSHIKNEIAVMFAKKNPNASSATWNRVLGIIRQFAFFLSAIDKKTEIPPLNLIVGTYHRSKPYIYTKEQINNLLKGCLKLGTRAIILKHTYYTLFGLIAVTGMRISEAISLKQRNVDFSDGIIFIKNTKFKKSRIIPLDKTTLSELEKYIYYKSKYNQNSNSLNLFISSSGTELKYHNVKKAFIRASIYAGLRKTIKGKGPRIHDIRHTFAVHTLTEWYKNGIDIEVNLPLLSTYLGHVNPANTYWYLSQSPDLLNQALIRLEKDMEGIL